MKTMLYVWFDICNFITKFIVRPFGFLLTLGPLTMEAGIHILVTYYKGKELEEAHEWFNKKSKVAKIIRYTSGLFKEIEY